MASDSAKGRIYNLWLVPMLAVGLCQVFISGGVEKAIAALAASCFVMTLLYPMWIIGGIGAGDIKFLSVLAVFFSLSEFIYCLVVSFLIGGGFSLLVIAWSCADNVRICGSGRLPNSYGHISIHMALPIGIAFLLHIGGIF
jgi:Flp pilus assembly protein protease CpaA